MKIKILGFNASPTKAGVLETAMAKVLESIGYEYELINLAKKEIKYCMGCVACAKNNKCILLDDMDELLEKFMKADAIVFGGITRHNGVNAIMQNFIERFFPLYHRKILSTGKPVAIVSAGLYSAQEAYKDMSGFVNAFKMNEVGSLIVGGNASCYKCGYGEECPQSAHVEINGKVPITKDTFYKFENNSECVKKAVELGKKIADSIKN